MRGNTRANEPEENKDEDKEVEDIDAAEHEPRLRSPATTNLLAEVRTESQMPTPRARGATPVSPSSGPQNSVEAAHHARSKKVQKGIITEVQAEAEACNSTTVL